MCCQNQILARLFLGKQFLNSLNLLLLLQQCRFHLVKVLRDNQREQQSSHGSLDHPGMGLNYNRNQVMRHTAPGKHQ